MKLLTRPKPARERRKHPSQFDCGGCGRRFWVEWKDENECYCQTCYRDALERWNAPGTGREPPEPVIFIDMRELSGTQVEICDCRSRVRICDDCYLNWTKARCGHVPLCSPLDDPGEHTSSWPAIVRGYEQDFG